MWFQFVIDLNLKSGNLIGHIYQPYSLENIDTLTKEHSDAAFCALKFMADFVEELEEGDRQQLFHDSRIRLSKLPVKALSVLAPYAALLQKDTAEGLQEWMQN